MEQCNICGCNVEDYESYNALNVSLCRDCWIETQNAFDFRD